MMVVTTATATSFAAPIVNRLRSHVVVRRFAITATARRFGQLPPADRHAVDSIVAEIAALNVLHGLPELQGLGLIASLAAGQLEAILICPLLTSVLLLLIIVTRSPGWQGVAAYPAAAVCR